MDDYKRARNEIRLLLLNAYKDSYILNGIDSYNNSIKDEALGIPEAFYEVLSHVILLVKKDFVMSLWKISVDNDDRIDNLSSLRRFKEKVIKQNDNNAKIKKPKTSKKGQKTEELVRKMRNTFLAHTEHSRSGSRIEVIDMRNLLDEYKNCYNILSELNGDLSYNITDNELKELELKTKLGMMFLIK